MPEIGPPEILVIIVYLFILGYLGWMGYRRTKTAADYMIAGRQVHPFVMAMSYGATFISTSAIVGFGGTAGLFGMSLLWLTFLNIFVGIFIAFVFLGGPTRRMGHHLDAHTFPELIGRRYDSKFIQIFAGLIIFIFIPLYAAAVLIGGSVFIGTQFGVSYEVALLVFSVIIAAYVIMGGLKGVMYTDALQGSIMFIGMIILLVATYVRLGGVVDAHQSLTDLGSLVPGGLRAIGHTGWTSMPNFGFGGAQYNLWWIVVSTITLGVGIGVLAQPQLAVRFMTVRSKKQLNRAVLIGGIFILVMTGTAFTVGSLSNAFFAKHGPILTGRLMQEVDAEKGYVIAFPLVQNEAGEWIDRGGANPFPLVLSETQEYRDVLVGADNSPVVQGRSISIVNARGDLEEIIPTFLRTAMPKWFGLLFLLTLLAAAMSTLSSQFHTLGTSLGRDVYEQIVPSRGKKTEHAVLITRLGVLIGIVIAVLISYHGRGGMIIARATAIFFGLCGSAFLPAFVGGLFWKRMTRAGAIASMVTGFVVTMFWLAFVKSAEVGAIGIVSESILAGSPNWPVVDPIVIALPLSAIAGIVVSLLTQPPSEAHLEKCFGEGHKLNS